MKVALLGNGPSLNDHDLSLLLEQYDKIVSCNRIYLHEQYSELANNCEVFITDPHLLANKNELYAHVPENHLHLPSRKSTTDTEFILDRSRKRSGSIKNAIANCIEYPNVIETASVITTVCIPYCYHIGVQSIAIFGIDMSYYNNSSEFNPYFYSERLNTGYRWTRAEADSWSVAFSKEFSAQLRFSKISVSNNK